MTPGVLRDLAISKLFLRTEEIYVIHHVDCGAQAPWLTEYTTCSNSLIALRQDTEESSMPAYMVTTCQ